MKTIFPPKITNFTAILIEKLSINNKITLVKEFPHTI